MRRREFFKRTVLAAGSIPLLGSVSLPAAEEKRQAPAVFDPTDWGSVRDQFPLTRSKLHMASFLLASHPALVASAIERHRRGFDEDPVTYWEENFMTAEPAVAAAAAEYLETDPGLIGLTDSTTMGLGLVYGALRLSPGDEILTTPHDHYSTIESLRLRAARTGAKIRSVALYDDPAATSVDQVVSRMRSAITPRTRVLAVTWVHSSTGVKLPIGAMAAALREVNRDREESERVLFAVDGVHGIGIENETAASLGCDFLIAGTHKWLFGPRGTGVVYGTKQAWDRLDLIIPNFGPWVGIWLGALPENTPLVNPGNMFTPGGFHSFDHRWALGEAFRFHQAIGKERVARRIHGLNSQAKEEMKQMPHVKLYTPLSSELSAGIICFDVEGHTPTQVVDELHEDGIIASSSPYPVSYARIAPSLMNDPEEVTRTVRRIAAMGS